jgi:hypothetical protein
MFPSLHCSATRAAEWRLADMRVGGSGNPPTAIVTRNSVAAIIEVPLRHFWILAFARMTGWGGVVRLLRSDVIAVAAPKIVILAKARIHLVADFLPSLPCRGAAGDALHCGAV